MDKRLQIVNNTQVTCFKCFEFLTKYFQMDEINTQFQCSLKLSAHLDIFQKHFKENKKTIFLVYISEHIPPIIYIILKNNDFFAKPPKLFTRSSESFLDMVLISICVRRKIRTLFLRKHAKVYHGGINSWPDTLTMLPKRHFRFHQKHK